MIPERSLDISQPERDNLLGVPETIRKMESFGKEIATENPPSRGIYRSVRGLFNRIFSSTHNPLYFTGGMIILFFLILLLTGIYLFLFYHSSSPYESVRYTVERIPLGRWARSLHRLSADLLIFFVILHAIQMGVQRRFFSPRFRTWFIGALLLGMFLIEGWTGIVLVWDQESQTLAFAFAELLDLLPLFSDKISRTIAGGEELGASFFFLFLFLHLAIPLILLFLYWLHTLHLRSPALFPTTPLAIGTILATGVIAILFPSPLAPPFDPFRLPNPLRVDLWYDFWIPLLPLLGTPTVWGFLSGIFGFLAFFPKLLPHPRSSSAQVNEALCTGCTQCALDCPFLAIDMVTRDPSSSERELVARVDPDLCASCGICAGSCAPMAMGIPGKTGRDQFRWSSSFARSRRGKIVLFHCNGETPSLTLPADWEVIPIPCAGILHTATVHMLLRYGARGVAILACPERGCRERLGSRWCKERLFHGREAELHPRVDRSKILFLQAGPGEKREVRMALLNFAQSLSGSRGGIPDPETACERDRLFG
jgi:ferredoxin/coenzyme F420-reducing hydrogenase delta subunit